MESQRKFPRVPVELPVVVTNQTGVLNKGITENLSMGGILLRQKYLSCKLGSLVFIELAEEGKFGTIQIPGEVVHVRAERDGNSEYLVGVQFKKLTKSSKAKISEYFTSSGEVL